MALFAIADLHLSIGEDKPMDIFAGWSDYVERLTANWKKLVNDNDTVVVAGDISWAMKLEETFSDFEYINNLPGKKIFLKGNHDYWWATKNKMDNYLSVSGFDTISILFNNAFECDNYAICGTRGWFLENEKAEDIKVLNREVGRLKMSIDAALKTGKEPIVFLHYPPIYGGGICEEIMQVLIDSGIKKCFYGHIHGQRNIKYAFEGEYCGIDFKLISCDKLSFIPMLVR
ncbi:MAG: metallophosphoesterase [Ruminococcus sp.]|nr:metallophosphoesterase [Ruminococcus sp.]